MSRADELFIENCKEILAHGVWDTEQEEIGRAHV